MGMAMSNQTDGHESVMYPETSGPEQGAASSH